MNQPKPTEQATPTSDFVSDARNGASHTQKGFCSEGLLTLTRAQLSGGLSDAASGLKLMSIPAVSHN